MTDLEIYEENKRRKQEAHNNAFKSFNPWVAVFVISVVYLIAWMFPNAFTQGLAALAGMANILWLWLYPVLVLVVLFNGLFKMAVHFIFSWIVLLGIGIAYGSSIGAI